MLGRLFLLAIAIAVLEIYLLVSIGGAIGASATVAMVLGTGFLGIALARREGTRVLRAWQQATQRGELPEEGMVSSLLVLIGGAMLVIPGVVTDVGGLLLLVPPVRRRVAKALKSGLERRFQVQGMGGPGLAFGFGNPSFFTPGEPEDVIDATAVDAEAHPSDPGDASIARR